MIYTIYNAQLTTLLSYRLILTLIINTINDINDEIIIILINMIICNVF